jgi:hypothetical protein
MSNHKMRLVGWQVQPVVMSDDGQNLTPVNVQPAQILAADWQAFKDGGDQAALDQVRKQIEQPGPTGDGLPGPGAG